MDLARWRHDTPTRIVSRHFTTLIFLLDLPLELLYLGLQRIDLFKELVDLTIFVAKKLPEGHLGHDDKVPVILVDRLRDFNSVALDDNLLEGCRLDSDANYLVRGLIFSLSLANFWAITTGTDSLILSRCRLIRLLLLCLLFRSSRFCSETYLPLFSRLSRLLFLRWSLFLS